MFEAVKLTKNAEPDKYRYCSYVLEFYSFSQFSWSDGGWGKNVIIFGADMSSSVHVGNKEKNILVLCQGQTQELHDTMITPEAKYSIKSTKSGLIFLFGLILGYNEGNSCFVCPCNKNALI